MKTVRVGINGFGRIGRIFFRQAFGRPFLKIVAVNDMFPPDKLAYLLKYDSVYGRYERSVERFAEHLSVNRDIIFCFQEKDPANLPWGKGEIDIVVDASGVFTTAKQLKGHLDAGAKRVVLTAPPKDDTIPMATPNVNEEALARSLITSNASCTTNATVPVVKILHGVIGIKKAFLNTTHSYTNGQGLVDGPDRKDDFRRGRAAAINMAPSSTGAAKAVAKMIPGLEGCFDGISVRVPTPAGSVVVITMVMNRTTSVEEVNNILSRASQKPEWDGILAVTNDPIVSCDIKGDPHGATVDLEMTRVVGGDLVSVMSWYDNEWGYTAMLVKHVLAVAKLIG